jgi:altronate dehydratase large subunit
MTDRAIIVTGYPRRNGAVGARNHVLVLPTVVCAGMAAAAIAQDDATVIVHQHGCDHVGVDATQAGRVLVGMAANANVAGTLLLGLGCETIQGRPLLDELSALDKTTRYLEIQDCGGSQSTVEAGRAELAVLTSAAAGASRAPSAPADVLIGVAVGHVTPSGLIQAFAKQVAEAGVALVVALPGVRADLPAPLADAPIIAYGEIAAGPLSVTVEASSLAEQHAALAASGAQVIVSLCSRGQAPAGSPICPVLAVALDPEMFAVLRDDFDLDGSGEPEEVAAALLTRAVAAFNGDLTAAERRGAQDFALHRLIRST